MDIPIKYQRIGRTVGSLASYGSLWIRGDHLLVVESSGFSEKYQRLLLREIRGIFIVPSRRRAAWATVWVLPLIVGGLVILADGPPFVSAILLLVGAMGQLWNFAKGPGCRVYAYTGVQNALLPSLVRRPRTDQLLAELLPQIVAAQGGMARPPEPAPAPPVAT